MTTLCDGLSAAHPCAAKIHDSTGKYKPGASPPFPTWLVAGGAEAECNILAGFYKLGVEMLGWPTGDVVYVYPTLGFNAKESAFYPANERRASDNAVLYFKDGQGEANNFEGNFKYTVDGVTKYYAGGAGIYDTPKACMEHICDKTMWLTLDSTGFLAEDWP